MNVDSRVFASEKEIRKNQECVSLQNNSFGVMGTVDFVDNRKKSVKVIFDRQAEEAKIHDPFLGVKLLQAAQNEKNNQ